MLHNACTRCGRELPPDVTLVPSNKVERLCALCAQAIPPKGSNDPFKTIYEQPARPLDATFEMPKIQGYRILGVLGRGGMGIVYHAVQERANQRAVAIKMIHDGHGRSAEQDQRFSVEVNAVSSVEHPNIVRVYEVGEVGGARYFTMEYCSGGTLYDRLKKQLMTATESASLIATLARAMEVVHDQKIIHRDLKPLNVLYDARGVPKITDFGLAKEIELGDVDTATGVVMGTLGYMSPEQASGHANKATPETDIYALGAILYSCLTGRVPFAGSTVPDTLQQIQNEEPISIKRLAPKTPRDLITICEKCLQKVPSRRYRRVAELADDVERFLSGRAITARPVSAIEKLCKAAKRKPMVAAFWALLGFTCIGAFAASLLLALANVRERALRREADAYAARTEKASMQIQQFSSLVLSSLSETDFWTRYFPLFVGQEGIASPDEENIQISPSYLRTLKETAKSKLTDHPHELAKILVTIANAMRSKMMFPETRDTLEEAQKLFGIAHETTKEDRARWKFSLASYQDEVGELGLAYKSFDELLNEQDVFNNPTELADVKVRLAWLCANCSSLLGAESNEQHEVWKSRSLQELKEASEIYSLAENPLARNKKRICDFLLMAGEGKFTLGDLPTLLIKLPPDDFLAVHGVLFVTAENLRKAGQYADAIEKFRELEIAVSSKLGKRSYLSLLALGALAGAEKTACERSPDEAFRQQCKTDAINHLNEGLATGINVSPKHPFLAVGYETLAQILAADNKIPEAIQAIKNAQAIAQHHPNDMKAFANRLQERLKQLSEPSP